MQNHSILLQNLIRAFAFHPLYLRFMKICHKCQKEIADDFFVGRQAQCPSCRSDLHCCLNCSFYEAGAYNDCRETQAERVLDKARSNFCDFFRFKESGKSSGAAGSNIKDKLESLFKKDWRKSCVLFRVQPIVQLCWREILILSRKISPYGQNDRYCYCDIFLRPSSGCRFTQGAFQRATGSPRVFPRRPDRFFRAVVLWQSGFFLCPLCIFQKKKN